MLREKIRSLCVWCQSVVPLQDWNSLSVWEALCKCVTKLNEVIENVNTNTEGIQKILDTISGDIDGLTENLKKYIDAQDAAIKAEVTEGYTAYADDRYDQSVVDNQQLENKLVGIINSQVELLNTAIIQGDAASRLYIDTEIIKIKEEIDGLQQRLPLITNPMTGKLDTINNVLQDIVSTFSYHAFTAGEWDAYGLTAEQADSYGMTAIDYQIWAKCTTGWYEHQLEQYFKMPDPWTGQFVPLQTVINKLAVYHMLGYTAQQLDALDFTAQDYDTFVSGDPVTAYNFNWTNWVNA